MLLPREEDRQVRSIRIGQSRETDNLGDGQLGLSNQMESAELLEIGHGGWKP